MGRDIGTSSGWTGYRMDVFWCACSHLLESYMVSSHAIEVIMQNVYTLYGSKFCHDQHIIFIWL